MKRLPPRRTAPRGNPLAALVAMNRTTPHTEAETAALMNPVRAAQVCLLEGVADDKDFARLGTCINLAAFRIHLKGQEIGNAEEMLEQLLLAGNALEEAQGIKARHGRYGVTGPGRQRVADGVDVYEAVVQASSPLQMYRAEQDLWKHLGRLEKRAA